MKQKKTITCITFLILGLGGLHAQETIPAAGGDATDVGGSLSYAVGQVVYTTKTGTNGSTAQGVQQPYEISTTLGINETSINLVMSVYPNPTTNYLNLKIEKFENISFQLIDLNGKIIENKKVSNTSTTVVMKNLPKATYFLKVTNNNRPVKTFKIIKN